MMRARLSRPAALLCSLWLAACGGGGDEGTTPPPAPPAQPGTPVGAAGGTVTGPNGATVVIPAGALASEVRILIEASSTGSPPLPSGFTVAGRSFALTPHGTTFAAPVTITLPFDPATVPAGRTPQLFKTINGQTQWEAVAGATFGANSVTAQISSFSIVNTVVPPVEALSPSREFRAVMLRDNGLIEEEIDSGIVGGGPMNLLFDFGGILPWPGGISVPFDGVAIGDITGNADGTEWAVGTEAPTGRHRTPNNGLGSFVTFEQVQMFAKRSPDATMSITFSEVFLETLDANLLFNRACPAAFRRGLTCDMVKAEVFVEVEAFTVVPVSNDFNTFFHVAGGATVVGIAGSWSSTANAAMFSRIPLWTVEDFDFDIESFEGAEEALVRMKLRTPKTFVIDLSSVALNQGFFVRSSAVVTAYNRDSPVTEFQLGARAFVRDPLELRGTTITRSGIDLLPTPTPVPSPTGGAIPPAVCATGPVTNPAAGTLQFSAPTFTQFESDRTPTIKVTRTGGSVGAVTATLRSSNGSAVAGTDYEPVELTVFFNDGDTSERALALPLIADTVHSEADTTVNLTLSEPGNCVALGAQSTAVLTIVDDDTPPPPPSFTLGGTVTGLEGTGLRLQDQNLVPIAASNGPFTFTVPTPTGTPYEVIVLAQPTNPVQVCSVTNGSGTIGNANVTNVLVNCVTPAPSGALDPSFGGGTGKVSPVFGGDETGMVLQPDGKIVMVGGGSGFGADFGLARYNVDGTLDTGFGPDGTGFVTTDLAGSNDDARAVALQSDGKIIVVGMSRVGSTDDFALVRYLPNGTVDTTFGTQGRATLDIGGGRDRAYAVAIQADNRIVVVGEAVMPSPGNTDFAVARFTANGLPDATFSGDGKLNLDIGGAADIAQNVLLQGSNILVSGVLTLANSPVLEHAGIARLLPDGTLDASFNTTGRRTFNGQAVSEGLALQSDGKILMAGHTLVGGDRHFALMRLNANGTTDTGFGTTGLATASFGTQDDYGRALAVHPDGRIFVAGQSSNLSNPDFGLMCFTVGGTLDNRFDSDGRLTIDFFGSFDGAENVVVQPNGRVVVSGFARNGNRTNYALARITP